MKLLFTAVLMTTLSMVSLSVQAETDKRWYVTPSVTYTLFDESNIDDDIGAQIAVGKAVADWMNLEGYAFGTQADTDGIPGEVDVAGIGLGALIFPWRDRIPVFGIIGAAFGKTEVDLDATATTPAVSVDEDTSTLDIGLGYLFTFPGHGIGIRAEYRYRSNFIEDLENTQDSVFTLGLQIPFGARKTSTPPPPAPVAPTPVAPLPPPDPAPEIDLTSKDPVVLDGVKFEFDSAMLTNEARGKLDRVAAKLKLHEDVNVLLKGYTCNLGSDSYNLGLSKRRAASAREYLIKQGVAADRMTSQGYGEADPIASNANKAGREQNRRVELQVVD